MWSGTGHLIGRADEITALRHALRDRAGTHLVVIEGAPGIGKTRLLTEAAAATRASGAKVLSAHGTELECELPFGVMRQLLDPVLRACGPGERERLLDGAAAMALPALDERPTAGNIDAFAVFAGLYWLIDGIAATAPLQLCVDDLHWADEPSLRALAYLLVRLDGVDAQLCVTLRPHEPGSEQALIDELIAAAPAALIRPAPLAPEESASLLRALLGDHADDRFCAACHASTDGNPLLLNELVREVKARGIEPVAAAAASVPAVIPRGLGPAFLRRVLRVHPDAPAVTQAVAILGDGVEPAHVAALAELAPGACHAMLYDLVRVGILAQADPPRFEHPLVRAAIAAAVLPHERATLHLRAARLLAADGAAPDRLAVHLTEVPHAGDAWVAQTLRTAAAETLSRGAPALAARFLRRALREPPPSDWRPELLLAAGQAEGRAGDHRAVAHLREALESAPDEATQAHAALALIRLLARSGELSAGAELALRVLDRLDPRDDLRLQLEAELLNLALLDGAHRSLGLERLRQLEPDALGNSPGACMLLAVLSSEIVARGESRAEAVSLAERALAGGWLLESVFLHAHAVGALILSGRYAQSIAVCDEFIAHARARGDLPGLAVAHAFRASGHWHAGSLQEALADSELATQLAPPEVAAVAAAFALAFRIEALVLRGDLDEARMTLPSATGPADQLPTALLLSARGRLRLAEGRLVEAVEDMRAVGRLVDRWQAPNSAFAPWRAEAAIALHAMGDHSGAQQLIDDEVRSAGKWGDPWLLGQAMRAQALVGPAGRRIPILGEAVELLRPSEARLELARTLAELGMAEHEAGLGRVVREHLREATEIAEGCGAPAVAQRARAGLIAAGGRPRRAAATGPPSLTPTEHRIARLAADGTTNRRIAQSLFITEKTVETHLASAYRKLGIRVRGELTDALVA